MSQKYQVCQWFLGFFKVILHQNRRKQTFGLLLTFSAFLAIAPSLIVTSQTKLLAETFVPSQNLEAASLFQQGVMRYNYKDFQAAENAFRQALQRDPNIAAAYNYLGSIMLQQNRLDAAVQLFSEAIRINPNVGEVYYNIGLALHKQGQKEAAITAYRQAIVINPTMAAAYYNQGLAVSELGQVNEAIALYQRAINLDSTNINAYSNLAKALEQQGQTSEAIAAYRKIIEINPENADAYNNMAGLMVNQGKAPEAIAVYQQAIRKIPKDAEAYYNLGVTWYNQGDYKKANGALKAARDRYRKQGNIEQASKVEQLMQQIVQLAAYKKNQVGQTQNTAPAQTPTSSVAIPEQQTADPSVSIPVEEPTLNQ